MKIDKPYKKQEIARRLMLSIMCDTIEKLDLTNSFVENGELT
jgi:hypothetical protein